MLTGMATGVGMGPWQTDRGRRRDVDTVMGPRQTEVVHPHVGAAPPPAAAPAAAGACQFEQDQLVQCMKGAASCQFFIDSLKACLCQFEQDQLVQCMKGAASCQFFIDSLKACLQTM